MHKPLYGHPLSGNCWGDKVEESVAKEGMYCVDGFTSVFVMPEFQQHANPCVMRSTTPKVGSYMDAILVTELTSQDSKAWLNDAAPYNM